MEKYFYCELDGNWYSKISIVRIIKKFGKNIKDYYDQHYKKDGEGICKFCGKETKFEKFSYYKFCDVKCASKFNKNSSNLWIEKSSEEKQEMINKMLTSRKLKNTNEDMHNKRKLTIQQKCGMSYKEFKSIQLKKRFSKMTDNELKEFFDKATKSRNCYKYHMYNLNGKLVRTQGYERFVLDILKEIFSEEKIMVDKNIKIYYKDQKGKTRRYYPDIVVNNILFEVKSKYTLTMHNTNTLLKMSASIKEGYIPILVVWDINNQEMCKKDLIETISSQVLSQKERFNDYPFIGVGNKQMIAEALGIQDIGL